MVCNGELEVIVVMAKRLEIYPKRSNFGSNDAIKFSTRLHTLAMISRVSYTSTLAQGAQDGLHKLIMW